MLHGQANVALVLPQADSFDFGTVEEQWDNLSDWLYTDTDNSSKIGCENVRWCADQCRL